MAAKIDIFSVNLLGKEIKPVTTAKDLGLIMDANLTFNEHVISTVSSCISRLGQINRVKHAFDSHTLLIIINELVFSTLFYCWNVWSNTSQGNLDKLKSIQNLACRIITNTKKFDHITPQTRILGWLSVRQHLYLRFASLAFKCMIGCVPDYLCKKIVKRCDISLRNN